MSRQQQEMTDGQMLELYTWMKKALIEENANYDVEALREHFRKKGYYGIPEVEKVAQTAQILRFKGKKRTV